MANVYNATRAPAYQQVTATSTASSLATLLTAANTANGTLAPLTAVPSWATAVNITVESGAIRYRADGVPPTTAVGQPVNTTASITINDPLALAAIMIIAQSGSPLLSLEFRG